MIIKKLSISIFLFINMASLVLNILIYKELLVNEGFDNVDEEKYTLEISNMEYYTEYELDDSGYINMPYDVDEYMIYFHSNSCSACLMSNVYVDKYIRLGYQSIVPIFFASSDKSLSLFLDEKLNINVTPTIVLFSISQEKYYVFEGLDEIISILDKKIQENYEK